MEEEEVEEEKRYNYAGKCVLVYTRHWTKFHQRRSVFKLFPIYLVEIFVLHSDLGLRVLPKRNNSVTRLHKPTTKDLNPSKIGA